MNYNYDPDLLPLLELLGDVEIELSDPVATRAMFSAMTEPMNAEVDRSGVALENRDIAGPDGPVPVRIYTPEGKQGVGPGLLHIHGGGFVIGDLESELGTCIALCRNLGITVVSVDYRLAPQSAFPAALDDCVASWEWLQQHGVELGVDPQRIVVAGESAGGGLAATLAQRLLDEGGTQPVAQWLFAPMLYERTATPKD